MTASLSTPRLLLRPWTRADLFAYHLVMSQDAVGRQLPRGRGYTADQSAALLDFWIEQWDRFGFGPWAVVDSATQRLMGHCGLRRLDDTDETELLYVLGRAFWGRGIATEAARASVEWAFETLGVTELAGFVKPDNSRSRAVMLACGFTEIGREERWGLDLVRYRRL